MTSGGEENWPEWPKDCKCDRIASVRVGCKPDELFLLLWGPKSPFVEKSQELLGNKDFKETWWCSSLSDLANGKQGSPPQKLRAAAEYKSMFRKNSCSGSGLGLKYVNYELQRCLEASEGGPFDIDVIVQTTATYGERFRPIIKHRIVGNGPNSCLYTVDYALVYIANTNGFLKKAIERGAAQGVTKNFQVLMEVLGTFKPVKEAGAEPSGSLETKDELHEEAVKTVEAIRTASSAPWWLKAGASEGATQLMQELSAYSASRVGLAGKEVYAAPVLAALVCMLLVFFIRSALMLLQASCTHLTGRVGLAPSCRAAFSILDVTASFRQAITLAVLFLLANLILGFLHSLLAPQPAAKLIALRRTESGRNVAVAVDQPPEEGIRYDGWEQSLESAAANIAEGEGELRRRNRSLGTAPSGVVTLRRREQLKEGFKSGFKNLMEHTKWPRNYDSNPASPGAATSPGAAASTAASPSSVTSVFANGDEPFTNQDRSKPTSKREQKRSPGNTDTAQNGKGKAAGQQDEGEEAKGGLSQPVNSTTGTLRDFMNPGGLLDMTEDMLGSILGSGKPSQKATAAPPPPPLPAKRDAATDYQLQEEAGEHSTMMELARLGSTDPEEAIGFVEEEIFENERYQPFRAWGHTWPGHFLPTDRVGHWSLASPPANTALDTSDFDAVAPFLKKGWEWKEEGWQIDVRGLLENAVDEEGWCYATDFGYIKWPPVPGQGKFRRVRDYVRRRRWYRSRVFAGVPLKESPSRPPSSVPPMHPVPSAPSAISSMLTRELNAAQQDQPLLDKPTSPFSKETLQNESRATAEPCSFSPSTSLAASKDSATASTKLVLKKQNREPSISRSLSGRQSAESVERSSLSHSSATSREGGKLESKLKGWGRLSKGNEAAAESSSGNDTDREARKERRVRVEDRRPSSDGPPSSSRDTSGMNFSERMSSMFAAASNTLRPSSANAKRDEPSSFSQTAKPAMGREGKAAAAGRQPPAARRTKSGDSISPENGLRSRDHTPAAVSSTGAREKGMKAGSSSGIRQDAKPVKSSASPPQKAAAQSVDQAQPEEGLSAPRPSSQQTQAGMPSADNFLAEQPLEAATAKPMVDSDGNPSSSGGKGSVFGSSPQHTGKVESEPASLQQHLDQRIADRPKQELAARAEPSAAQSQPNSEQEVDKVALQQSSISTARQEDDSAEGKAPSQREAAKEKPLGGVSAERSRSQLLARQAAPEDPLSVSPAKHSKTLQTGTDALEARQKTELTQAESSQDHETGTGQAALPEAEVSSQDPERQAGTEPRKGSNASFPSANTGGVAEQTAEDKEEIPTDSAGSASAVISAVLTGNANPSTTVEEDLHDSPAARLLASALSGNSVHLDPSEQSDVPKQAASTQDKDSTGQVSRIKPSSEVDGSGSGEKDTDKVQKPHQKLV